ncbi:MAG: RNA methyltransferase [Eubacterium sp.]|nr:RNA methyltransferase [Eubacterium sp.]
MITGKDNPRIKKIKKLLEKSKTRSEEKAFVMEGVRAVREAQKCGLIKELYITESVFERMSENTEVDVIFNDNNIGVREVVKDDIFDKISDTKNPQGILAVVSMPNSLETQIDNKEKASILILDEVRDPGNIGTIIRTAEGAGFDAILFTKGCADIYQPKVVRSTMGSVLRVPCIRCEEDTGSELKKIKNRGYTLYATALENAEEYSKVTYNNKSAVVIGNEANGVSKATLEASDFRIKIPMKGELESLNAAVAAALVMYKVSQGG